MKLQKNMLAPDQTDRMGFSLIEILISLLIVSGAIVTIFSGFDTAAQLSSHSAFESEAALIAERELELLKAEFISDRITHSPGRIGTRFPQKPGWKVNTAWAAHDEFRAIRILCTVEQQDRTFKLESFVYQPERSADS